MRRVDQMGPLNRLGKALLPSVAALAANPVLAAAVRLAETALAMLQGKGAGSGWDLEGEVLAAARVIRIAQPIVVDVGANRGEWSLALDRLIATQRAHYILVEPALACQESLEALSIARKSIVRAAASDHSGEGELIAGASGDEAASLHTRRDTYHQPGHAPLRESVPLLTLDALFDDLGLPRVDFLKLDVEGHELAALRGAQRSLESGRVRALAFEFGSGQINSRTWFHDFWDLLHPLGYRLARILPGGGVLPITAYYEDLEYFRGVSNYLAILRHVDGEA